MLTPQQFTTSEALQELRVGDKVLTTCEVVAANPDTEGTIKHIIGNSIYLKEKSDFYCNEKRMWTLLERPAQEITWSDLKGGEFIVDETKAKMFVLGVLNELVFLGDNHGIYYQRTATKKGLQDSGWSIVQPKTKRTLTKEEAEKEFGVIITT